MKTYDELVIRALRILGVLATGQEPSDENARDVKELVQPMLDRLEALDISQAPAVDQIPLTMFEPLAIMLAQEASQDFGEARDEAAAARATFDLRMLGRDDGVSPFLTTDVALIGYRRNRLLW